MELSRMERRQHSINLIRQRIITGRPALQRDLEDVVHDPTLQYSIGKSQKSYIHLPTFLRQNTDNPAVKACDSVWCLFAS